MKQQHFKIREERRAWLRENHDKETALWLVYEKKHTGIQTVDYNVSVEEALCELCEIIIQFVLNCLFLYR